MTRQFAAAVGLLVSLVVGCVPMAPPPDDHSSTYNIIIDSDESGGFYAELPTGRVFWNYAEYEAAMPDILADADELGQPVAFAIGPYLGASLDESFGSTAEENEAPTGAAVESLRLPTIYGYTFSFDPWPVRGQHVGGCIGRVANKIAIRLNQGSRQVFDAHFAGWREGWVPCFGVYESVSHWCISSCSQSAREMIGRALIAAGAAAVAAWAIAQAAAPYAVAALAL